MNIITKILTLNDCYKQNKRISIEGLMLHSVGCPQPKAMVFINQWNKSGVEKAVHGFIEPDEDVYQTLPWDGMKGWHGASGPNGSVNNTHLGFEMTEPSTIKYTKGSDFTDLNPSETKRHVMGTYKTAVELFAKLCTDLNLNPLADGVIISHSEGNKRGIASAHADVEHLWSKFGLTMDGFRKDVKSKMNPDYKQQGIEAVKYLASKGRITDSGDWISKIATVKNLEFMFIKWKEDFDKITH